MDFDEWNCYVLVFIKLTSCLQVYTFGDMLVHRNCFGIPESGQYCNGGILEQKICHSPVLKSG